MKIKVLIILFVIPVVLTGCGTKEDPVVAADQVTAIPAEKADPTPSPAPTVTPIPTPEPTPTPIPPTPTPEPTPTPVPTPIVVNVTIEYNIPAYEEEEIYTDEDLQYLNDIAERDYIDDFGSGDLAPDEEYVIIDEDDDYYDEEALQERIRYMMENDLAVSDDDEYDE